jgi:hypothetical protein
MLSSTVFSCLGNIECKFFFFLFFLFLSLISADDGYVVSGWPPPRCVMLSLITTRPPSNYHLPYFPPSSLDLSQQASAAYVIISAARIFVRGMKGGNELGRIGPFINAQQNNQAEHLTKESRMQKTKVVILS